MNFKKKRPEGEISPLVKINNKIRNSKFTLQNAYSPDHITLDICDELGNFYLVPIKQAFVENEKIFVKLANEIYLFSIDESKIKTSKSLGSKGIRKLYYSTKDINPVDLSDVKTMDSFQKNNPGLRRIEAIHAVLIQVCNELVISKEIADHSVSLGKKTDGHSIEADESGVKYISMTEAVKLHINKLTNNNDQDEQTINFQRELLLASKDFGTDRLVLPLSPISSYLSSTVQTSPINLISIIRTLESKWFEWAKIANPNKKPFQHWFIIAGIIGFVLIVGAAGYILSGASDPATLFDQIEELNKNGTSPEDFLRGITVDPSVGLFDTVANLTNGLVPGASDIVETVTNQTVSAVDPIERSDIIIQESPIIISEALPQVNLVPDVVNGTNGTTAITETPTTLDTNDTSIIIEPVSIEEQLTTMETGDKLSLASELNGGEFTESQINLFLGNSDILDMFIVERYN